MRKWAGFRWRKPPPGGSKDNDAGVAMKKEKKISDYLDPEWVHVFEIPGFSDRMTLIRGTVRPGLLALSAELSANLSGMGPRDYWPHVASHMRRRVNPPPETWLALGPEKRGYKAYAHSGVFIGASGLSVRFVLKDEAEAERRHLGKWLMGHGEDFLKWKESAGDVLDYGPVHNHPGKIAGVLSTDPVLLGKRLAENKTASLDIGFPADFGMTLSDLIERIRGFEPLYLMSKGS
jgi:uncharacterized protein YktB (UPF0637 family)